MAPQTEKSHLKRDRVSVDSQSQDSKRPRRSERLASQTTGLDKSSYLPSPLTHQESTSTEIHKEATVTPPEGRPSQLRHHTPPDSSAPAFSSPPGDTQALSQFPPKTFIGNIEDEAAEGVWGYLIPLDDKFGDALILKKRDGYFSPAVGAAQNGSPSKGKKGKGLKETEKLKGKGSTPELNTGGYLIGRHPECDFLLEIPTISNRHCLIFNENKRGDSVAILEDLSSNGTFVNEAIIGRNKRRELEDGDEITILDEARFIFRYPRTRDTNGFRQQYQILKQLGKGHFATVHLCAERATGMKYAVKRFEKRGGDSQRASDNDGLQQEIAVLMSVNHPNVLCLKDTFHESDGVYLVLELAPEGELFHWIVTKQKLTEAETRKVFVQLFQGLKYLHDRNIVHRDIKPENILMLDKNLTVKLADFGLAKIIGEDSFTTTLCGTPSYVAPEILQNTGNRRYTRAVDIWALGVVLYICLCGFPPFSDELNTPDNPYTLAEQIQMGQFDYPSPYWDSVGDPALDLIDKMLTVDVDARMTIDGCLKHPWLTGNYPSVADSTDGLTGAMDQLDFSKRKVERERTLISSLNDVTVREVVEDQHNNGHGEVKIFDKNTAGKGMNAGDRAAPEPAPAANRDAAEFINMGGRGDQTLFSDSPDNRSEPDEASRGRKR